LNVRSILLKRREARDGEESEGGAIRADTQGMFGVRTVLGGLDLPPLTDGSSSLNQKPVLVGGDAMTAEEELIQRYFDAFNSHDIEGVME
jgi:hypothetical protein